MDEFQIKRNELLADRVIRGLKARNMEGYYVADKKKALDLVLKMIPTGASVSWGGSTTLEEIGIKDILREGDYQVIDRDRCSSPEEKHQTEIQALDSDFFLASSNAITEEGMLVNIDGQGNRIAGIIFGPRTVILVVGMQKVSKDLDEAIKRVRNEAAPIIAQKFPLSTPCKTIGSCVNCMAQDTICCQLLVTRFSRFQGRIKVILVGETIGY